MNEAELAETKKRVGAAFTGGFVVATLFWATVIAAFIVGMLVS